MKSNKFKIFTGYSVLLFFGLLVTVSCEKDQISGVEANDGNLINPLGWVELQEYRNVAASRVYVTHQGQIGSSRIHNYRVQGNIKDVDDPQKFKAIDKVMIGDVEIPQLRADETYGENTGVFNMVFGPLLNNAGYESLNESLGMETAISIIDENGIADNISVRLMPALGASVFQEGTHYHDLTELDKSKPLTVSWSTDNQFISPRDGAYTDYVGAMVYYSPSRSARENDLNVDLPDDVITSEFVVPFDVGSITFTEADLALFPSYGMITVYIGSVRYEVDENGNLVSTPGGTSVVSGGIQGGGFIRIIEP